MFTFDDLGFSQAFQFEVNPEFPGDGPWSCPTAGFDTRGERTPFLARDSSVVVRFRPEGRSEWVASFTGSGGSILTALYGVPAADRLLVVLRGSGLIVQATDPDEPAIAVGWAIHQVVPVDDPPLLLLVGFYEVTALDNHGVRWTTPRLCLDDLRIDAVRSGKVMCSGEFMPRDSLVLDLNTGEQLSGPTFISTVPRPQPPF